MDQSVDRSPQRPDVLHPPPERSSKLSDAAKRFKAALKNGDVGPTMIASEIVGFSRNWERYRSEADGRDFRKWLEADVSPGRRLNWWMALDHATVTLTTGVATRLHHRAVVYLVQSVPEQYRAQVQEAALALARKQQAPVSYTQLIERARNIVPHKHRARACSDCDALRAQVREMGGEPVL